MTALAEYDRFCAGVQAISGIDLAQYKRGQMERRIRTFATRRGHESLPVYLRALETDAAELESFLDRVTINVSQLWRHPEQWIALGGHVLPELGQAGRVRAWSAGCSYGAEAYTLAAVAAEAKVRIQVTGTDIDGRMVARAREGRLSAEDARSAPRAQLERWFEAAADGGWIARPELRAACRFEIGDLLRMDVRPASHDLILCRNTVIYFTEDVRDALHARLAAALRPGGYLVIGSTERVTNPASLGLHGTHPFVYRKS
jgi:chemotaxis protein methyltransferase CheR